MTLIMSQSTPSGQRSPGCNIDAETTGSKFTNVLSQERRLSTQDLLGWMSSMSSMFVIEVNTSFSILKNKFYFLWQDEELSEIRVKHVLSFLSTVPFFEDYLQRMSCYLKNIICTLYWQN